MAKLTKNQKVAYAKVDADKAYTLNDATKMVKEVSFTKFDASVDLSVRLGVDPRKANQMVRGIVTLPCVGVVYSRQRTGSPRRRR